MVEETLTLMNIYTVLLPEYVRKCNKNDEVDEGGYCKGCKNNVAVAAEKLFFFIIA